MDEVKFLDEPGVLVTSTRVDIGGQTFATRNIGSVRMSAAGSHPIVGAVLLAGGVVALVVGANAFFGVGIAGLGAWLLWEAAQKRSLVLVTGGGEVSALKGRKAHIERVRAAVANAIAAR
jgi:hypothetical protein